MSIILQKSTSIQQRTSLQKFVSKALHFIITIFGFLVTARITDTSRKRNSDDLRMISIMGRSYVTPLLTSMITLRDLTFGVWCHSSRRKQWRSSFLLQLRHVILSNSIQFIQSKFRKDRAGWKGRSMSVACIRNELRRCSKAIAMLCSDGV